MLSQASKYFASYRREKPGSLSNRWYYVWDAIQNATGHAARLDKGLRKGQAKLAQDILLLVLRLRPSFLVDYVRVKLETLQSILRQIEDLMIRYDTGNDSAL